jgi:hypothetical protein
MWRAMVKCRHWGFLLAGVFVVFIVLALYRQNSLGDDDDDNGCNCEQPDGDGVISSPPISENDSTANPVILFICLSESFYHCWIYGHFK